MSSFENLCKSLKPFARPGQMITCTHSGQTQAYLDKPLLEAIISNLLSNAVIFVKTCYCVATIFERQIPDINLWFADVLMLGYELSKKTSAQAWST